MPPETEELSLRDGLSEIYDRVEAANKEEPAEVKPAVTSESEPVSQNVDNEPSKVETKGREPDGRFKKKELAAETKVGSAEQPAIEPEKAIEPPVSWDKEQKTLFSALPKQTQEFLNKREAEREKFVQAKSQEAAESKRYLSALEQTISPYKELIQREANGNPFTAIASLFDTYRRIHQDPKGTIAQLAQQFGVDLNGTASQQPPEYSELMRRQQALEQHLVRQQQQQQQAHERQQQQQAFSQIDQFKSQKDERGSPKYPHFETVKEEMAGLMELGRVNTLDEAYQKAIWMNDSARTEVLASQEAKRIDEAKKTSAQARKSAGTQVRSSDALPSAHQASSMRDTASAVYDRLHSG